MNRHVFPTENAASTRSGKTKEHDKNEKIMLEKLSKAPSDHVLYQGGALVGPLITGRKNTQEDSPASEPATMDGDTPPETAEADKVATSKKVRLKKKGTTR